MGSSQDVVDHHRYISNFKQGKEVLDNVSLCTFLYGDIAIPAKFLLLDR